VTAKVQKRAHAQLVEDRFNGIGGSDIGSVFSLRPYGCARALAYEKQGWEPDHPFHGNNATERGQKLEDLAASEYSEATGRQIRRVAGGLTGIAKRDREFPYMLVHADREIVNDPRGPGMLSVKVPGRENFQDVKYNGLPSSWLLQLQYEMSIFNRTWGDTAVFWADGWQLLPSADVELDTEIVKQVRLGVQQFWEDYVKTDALPEKLPANDRRCGRCPFRTTCQGAAMLEGVKENNADLEYDPSLSELVQLRFDQQELVDQATELLDETNAKIKEAMGSRGAVETDGARIYYREQAGRVTFQNKNFNKAYSKCQLINDDGEMIGAVEGLMKKFTNTGAPYRVLKVYAR